ncbi:MAG TPA: class D sortase [Terriglobia bacterium]|nr:class D sortase [Terriglobia bacterium]
MTTYKPRTKRSSWGRALLRMMELVFLLIGITAIGYYLYVQSYASMFQAYQGWRLDQLRQRKPASITLYIKQWVPLPWDTETAAPPGRQAARGSNPESPGAAGSGADSIGRPGAIPKKPEGTLIGRIEIPKLKLSAIVLEGVQPDTLRLAVGHLPGTPLPGDSGNVELAGHRDTFFRGLRRVQKGDSITLSTVSGATHNYRVESLAIVSPNNTDILNASPGPGVNLITCYPFNYVGAAPKRFVVYAAEVKDTDTAMNGGPAGQGAKSKTARSPALAAAQIGHGPKSQYHNNVRSVSHRTTHRRSQHTLTNNTASGSSGTSSGDDSTSPSDGRTLSNSNSLSDPTSARPLFDRVRTFFRKVIKPGRSEAQTTPSATSTGS